MFRDLRMLEMNSEERESFRLWVENLECWFVNSSGEIVKAKSLAEAITGSQKSYYAFNNGLWHVKRGNVEELLLEILEIECAQGRNLTFEIYKEFSFAYVEIFPITKRLYEYSLLCYNENPKYNIVNNCADLVRQPSKSERRLRFVEMLRSMGALDE